MSIRNLKKAMKNSSYYQCHGFYAINEGDVFHKKGIDITNSLLTLNTQKSIV